MQELFLGTIPTQKGNVLHFAQCVGIFLQGSTTCMGRKPLQKFLMIKALHTYVAFLYPQNIVSYLIWNMFWNIQILIRKSIKQYCEKSIETV